MYSQGRATDAAQPLTASTLIHGPSLHGLPALSTLTTSPRHTRYPLTVALTLPHSTLQWLSEGPVPVTTNSLPPQRAHVQLQLLESSYLIQCCLVAASAPRPVSTEVNVATFSRWGPHLRHRFLTCPGSTHIKSGAWDSRTTPDYVLCVCLSYFRRAEDDPHPSFRILKCS